MKKGYQRPDNIPIYVDEQLTTFRASDGADDEDMMPDNPKLANIKIKTSAYDRKKPGASKSRKRSRSQKSLNQTKEESSD